MTALEKLRQAQALVSSVPAVPYGGWTLTDQPLSLRDGVTHYLHNYTWSNQRFSDSEYFITRPYRVQEVPKHIGNLPCTHVILPDVVDPEIAERIGKPDLVWVTGATDWVDSSKVEPAVDHLYAIEHRSGTYLDALHRAQLRVVENPWRIVITGAYQDRITVKATHKAFLYSVIHHCYLSGIDDIWRLCNNVVVGVAAQTKSRCSSPDLMEAALAAYSEEQHIKIKEKL